MSEGPQLISDATASVISFPLSILNKTDLTTLLQQSATVFYYI